MKFVLDGVEVDPDLDPVYMAQLELDNGELLAENKRLREENSRLKDEIYRLRGRNPLASYMKAWADAHDVRLWGDTPDVSDRHIETEEE